MLPLLTAPRGNYNLLIIFPKNQQDINQFVFLEPAALSTSKIPLFNCFRKASAIWLRAELWMQTNSILCILFGFIVSFVNYSNRDRSRLSFLQQVFLRIL